MEIELINAWIDVNAPDSIKDDLKMGVERIRREQQWAKQRREKYPNEGKIFTEQEIARIMELEHYLTSFEECSLYRDLEIEKEFGRPIKSVKGRLRRLKAKVAG